LKYLIIAALVGLVFVVVYTRLRPYLQLLGKIVESLKVVAAAADDPQNSPRDRAGLERKLVRCASCGTWIPSDRSMRAGKGSATYCSAECLEGKSSTQGRKLAG